MNDVRDILFRKGITLSDFASRIKVSRPTLNTYISLYERGETIPKEKYDIIFKTLFDETDKDDNEFETELSDFTHRLKREETMGIIDLGAEETDLFNSTMELMKKDFESGNFDINVYKFINMLISGYQKEQIYSHLVNYFMVLNGVKDYKTMDFEMNTYLLYYFDMFTKDKHRMLEYDFKLHKKFVNKILEIEREKESQKNLVKEKVMTLMMKEINKLHKSGIELSDEEFFAYLKKKLESK